VFIVLLIFLFVCLVVASTAVLGAPGLLAVPVLLIIGLGLLISGVVGSGGSSRHVLRKAPKAELLGPGGPDDPDAGTNQPVANDPAGPVVGN
jgi:hypothetical protein